MNISQEETQLGFSISRLTKVGKYASHQFKVMHNTIFWNDRLYHFKYAETNMCTFCKTKKENFHHVYSECTVVEKIWKELIEYAKRYDYFIHSMNPKNILLNTIHDDSKHFLNLACLIVKQYVYAAKCQNHNSSAAAILKEISFIKNMKKKQIVSKAQKAKFNRKWKEIKRNILEPTKSKQNRAVLTVHCS